MYCHSITEAFLLGPSLSFSQRILDLKMESGLETKQGIVPFFFFFFKLILLILLWVYLSCIYLLWLCWLLVAVQTFL